MKIRCSRKRFAGSGRVVLGCRICIVRDLGNFNGMRDLTTPEKWDSPKFRHECSTGWENDIQNSEDRSSWCGTLVKKEWECARDPTPPPPSFQTLVLPRASSLACIASVSVWFRNKERARNDEERTGFWPCEKWHPRRPILRAAFDSRSLFFAPKPHGKTCCTGYIQSGPVTDRKPETRCTTQKGWKTPHPPPPPTPSQ